MQNNPQNNTPNDLSGYLNPFQKFAQYFQGNPGQITNNLLQSGRVTQAQYNFARQMATRFQGLLRQVFK